MANLNKATTLRDAYAVLDPLRPLEGENLDRFYAERPKEASINSLVDELQLEPGEEDKTIFTGHRGSGKTTELARVEKELGKTHTVIRFGIEGMVNLADLDYPDLLVALGLQVFRQAREMKIRLDEKKLEALRFWYETYILERDEKPLLQTEAGAELDAAIASINLKISTQTPRRRSMRAEAQANLSNLIERLNDLLEDLHAKSGRRTLVIIDGLDKVYHLKTASDLFMQGANALLAPRCRIIYTIPFALYHDSAFQQVRSSFSRWFALPNVKTNEKDGSRCESGRKTLREVLSSRMEEQLISPQAKERVIELSGGLLRELISLTRSALVRARSLQGDQGPIEVEDVEYAALQVRNSYRRVLTEEHYRELWRIRQGGQFLQKPVVQELIHNLSLLEYNGGSDAWWAVHPIVLPLVEEWSREVGKKTE